MSPILTVTGATGAQGGSVIDSALKAGVYQIRAVTRNVESESAKALAARGVEVVAADLNDEESLVKAFEGTTAIYAVTNFFEPFSKGGPELGTKVEVEQGKNLANAAIRTPTLKHYIWSTLPNAMKISNGQYLIPHFEAKNRIDNYIREQPQLLAKTTFLWVTWYASNYNFPMFTPNFMKTSGKYIHLNTVPPTVPILSIGDAYQNVGLFTNAILAKPELTLNGQFVLAYIEKTTIGDLLERWSKESGKPAVYVQTTSVGAFDSVFPMWGHEMGIMMLFWEKFMDKSWSGENYITKEELKITEGFVSSDEVFKTLDLGH